MRTLPGFANNYYTNDVKSRGWLPGGNLKYNINDNWYLSARGGWFHSQVESEGTGFMTAPPLKRIWQWNTTIFLQPALASILVWVRGTTCHRMSVLA